MEHYILPSLYCDKVELLLVIVEICKPHRSLFSHLKSISYAKSGMSFQYVQGLFKPEISNLLPSHTYPVDFAS